MDIIIHRGTHQIGGISTEIKTKGTRLFIDMGRELCLDSRAATSPLSIDGATNNNGDFSGILITHYHGDHVGQIVEAREDIPIYIGALAKDILLKSVEKTHPTDTAFINRIKGMNIFEGGKTLHFGDIKVTPYSVDHSACDSYMFLIEAEGKRVLYTGDFRMHGFRGKAMPKILSKIGKVDALVTEGTAFSRSNNEVVTERALQQKIKGYMERYKYVYVCCSSVNLERICALSKATPKGKYFICDKYQYELLDLIEKHWQKHSPLYRRIKKTYYDERIKEKAEKRGFLMVVRDNWQFRRIMGGFPKEQSIVLYSMWDGYRTKKDSPIQELLSLANTWETFHTSGHASMEDIRLLIDTVKPSLVIPMHTDAPSAIESICGSAKVIIAKDKEKIVL